MPEGENPISIEEMQEKVVLMEQFAVGILDAFHKQTENNNDTQETVATLSKKIQELALNSEELFILIEKISNEGISVGSSEISSGAAVDEKQVLQLIEKFLYERLDLTRILKGHTSRIFQEVERRYFLKFPPEKQKKSSPIKIIASTVAVTCLVGLATWGVFVNVKDKPYFELIIPKGEKVMWKEANETQPRQIGLTGELIVPLAQLKKGKYLFYTYDSTGVPVKDGTGHPVEYYIYDNAVNDHRVQAIKLGIAN